MRLREIDKFKKNKIYMEHRKINEKVKIYLGNQKIKKSNIDSKISSAVEKKDKEKNLPNINLHNISLPKIIDMYNKSIEKLKVPVYNKNNSYSATQRTPCINKDKTNYYKLLLEKQASVSVLSQKERFDFYDNLLDYDQLLLNMNLNFAENNSLG
jgi:hypothetical protein